MLQSDMSIRRWLIAGWFSLGLIVGGRLPQDDQIGFWLWVPAFGLAVIPLAHVGTFVRNELDALRHGGRKAKRCLVENTDHRSYSHRCQHDTREESGKYEWFCAEHLALIKEAQARWLASPERTTMWGDYEVTPDQTLREQGATLLRIVPREQLVPVLEGVIYRNWDL